jgi:hypothetical protein
MTDPHTPRIEGNRLYGRGSYDMKAGVAACMDAAIRAMQIPRRGDVLFTAVVDEEYASIGTEALLREYRGDAVIVTEPSHLNVGIAHKGFAWYAVDVHGVAAHGSQPTDAHRSARSPHPPRLSPPARWWLYSCLADYRRTRIIELPGPLSHLAGTPYHPAGKSRTLHSTTATHHR